MNEFLRFVADIMNVDVSELSGETEYESISQWDSLMHVRLVAEVEEKYGIMIPFEDIAEIKKLSDFYNYIKQ